MKMNRTACLALALVCPTIALAIATEAHEKNPPAPQWTPAPPPPPSPSFELLRVESDKPQTFAEWTTRDLKEAVRFWQEQPDGLPDGRLDILILRFNDKDQGAVWVDPAGSVHVEGMTSEEALRVMVSMAADRSVQEQKERIQLRNPESGR